MCYFYFYFSSLSGLVCFFLLHVFGLVFFFITCILAEGFFYCMYSGWFLSFIRIRVTMRFFILLNLSVRCTPGYFLTPPLSYQIHRKRHFTSRGRWQSEQRAAGLFSHWSLPNPTLAPRAWQRVANNLILSSPQLGLPINTPKCRPCQSPK